MVVVMMMTMMMIGLHPRRYCWPVLNFNVQWKTVSLIAHFGYELREIKVLLYEAIYIFYEIHFSACLIVGSLREAVRFTLQHWNKWVSAFSLRRPTDHCTVLALQACWGSEHAGRLVAIPCGLCRLLFFVGLHGHSSKAKMSSVPLLNVP